MHILFFSHYFPPEGNAPASRIYENAKRWVAQGHRVTVITSVPNAPAGKVFPGFRNRLFPQRAKVDGIDVVRVWTFIAANKGTVKRIANYVSYMISAVFASIFIKRPDIVIGTSPQFFCGWAGILAGWLHRRPIILEIRDIWPESITAVGAMQNRRLLKIVEWLERHMYAAAWRIVTVGEGYRRRLIEKKVPPAKMDVIMNGVDRQLFYPRPPRDGLRRQWGLSGKFVCSYIGTIGMACGLDVCLRAAKLLQERGREDIVFLLIGDGAERESLQRRAREENVSQVVLTGPQPHQTIPDYFTISDACLVHLKKTDLFCTVMPSKIFEAAGMAKPIIIGVAGFAAQVVRQAENGIEIEPENENQLVDAVLQLADDPARCSALGQAGYRYITEHFDRDKLASDYLEIIEKMATGQTKRL